MKHYLQRNPEDVWPGSAAAAAGDEWDEDEDDDDDDDDDSTRTVQILATRRAQYIQRVRTFMEYFPTGIAHSKASGLAAPLRAFTFAEAAGEAILENSVMRWPPRTHQNYVERSGDTCFRRTILLLDEAHNLMRSNNTNATTKGGDDDDNVATADAMATLRRRVIRAREAVVVLFTATPILRATVEDPDADVRSMMALVKGSENRKKTDEGFVSWVMDRPRVSRLPSDTV